MAFFAFALLCAAAAESTTTTASPTAEENVARMLQNETNTTPAPPTAAPTPMPTPGPTPGPTPAPTTAAPTPTPTAAPTPTPLDPVEVAVAYTLDEASFTAMKAKKQTDVYASFEKSFATATGVLEEDVTVVSMTVGGEAVEFSGRRLEDTSVEVNYEIEVADEAASAVALEIVDDIETHQAGLAAALVSEVADSLDIAGMVAEAAPGGVAVETPVPTAAPTSGAFVAALAVGLLY